jgi:translation initiation factor IF-3
MDYGKFLYQQEKKEREAKKHQKQIVVKEVKFRINVDDTTTRPEESCCVFG